MRYFFKKDLTNVIHQLYNEFRKEKLRRKDKDDKHRQKDRRAKAGHKEIEEDA